MMFPGKLFQINFTGIVFQKCDKGNSVAATPTLNVMFHSSPSPTISTVGLVLVSTFLYISILFSLIFFQAEENQPDHPGNSQSCKVLVHALTFFMLENTNSLLHLEKVNTFLNTDFITIYKSLTNS